ncbi:MAG TPA: SRPBCC domain-containing protein [Thermoleophilaceae bacterium]
MEAGTSQVVECEIRIEASPETVFEFFTDPAKAVQWMGQTATLDPRVGGIYKVTMSNDWVVVGEYVEVDPPRRVVFTWGWEDGVAFTPPGSSTVEIDLIPDGDATLVRLVHSGLPSEASAAHRGGWEKFLPRLAAVASGRDPGPDPHKELMS